MNKNIKNKKAFSLIELSIVILIVGIIVAGVTQASRLVSAFKLNTARNITQSSPVNSIKDLVLWLESTSEKSFDVADQDDGLAVDNWYDINPQSTTKINFTQATSAKQPLYKTSSATINSLPTIKFDGVTGSANGDYLANTTTPLTTISQSDQITIFIVEKVNSSVDNSTFFITTDDGTNRINLHSPASGSLYFDMGQSGSGTSRIGVSTPAGFVGNARVISLIRKPTSVGVIRINGADALNTTMTSTFGNTALAANMLFTIGGIYDSVDLFYKIDAYIGEFIIFRRALKADEITDVERYLGKKWGVTIP